jgi:hypothetical protein
MEVFICVAWNIWKDRNDLIFRFQHAEHARWNVRFKHDLHLHKYRLKEDLVQPMLDWMLSRFT